MINNIVQTVAPAALVVSMISASAIISFVMMFAANLLKNRKKSFIDRDESHLEEIIKYVNKTKDGENGVCAKGSWFINPENGKLGSYVSI